MPVATWASPLPDTQPPQPITLRGNPPHPAPPHAQTKVEVVTKKKKFNSGSGIINETDAEAQVVEVAVDVASVSVKPAGGPPPPPPPPSSSSTDTMNPLVQVLVEQEAPPAATATSEWTKIEDDHGVYYSNTVTGESSWEAPAGYVAANGVVAHSTDTTASDDI